MGRHTLVPPHTQRTQHTNDISARAVPSLGIKGPKSLLATHSIQQSLAKRGFISTLGQHIPISKREYWLWQTYMLIVFVNCFKPCSFRILSHRGLGRSEMSFMHCLLDWLSLCSFAAVLTPRQSLIVRAFFFFVACIVFSLSPGIFAQVQGVELNFLFNICYAARGRM